MRIAVSGTHFMGKSTLIGDFINKHPYYRSEVEPWYKLQDQKEMELSFYPSIDSLIEQLDYSIDQLFKCTNQQNIIFDRCPIDFLAYAMSTLAQDSLPINNSEVADRFGDIKEALNNLDLIVFLPITKEYVIEYTEENPAYRQTVDRYFKKIYRDDICDIFPRYNHPKIVEIAGDRLTRLKKLEGLLI